MKRKQLRQLEQVPQQVEPVLSALLLLWVYPAWALPVSPPGLLLSALWLGAGWRREYSLPSPHLSP